MWGVFCLELLGMGNGGIGFVGQPWWLDVENLEVVSGSGGVFFDVENMNLGGVSEDVDGIATFGGDVDIKSAVSR
ncbi:MAG: hypothetical protein MGG11_06745 [Trichodesmium sp. MAG_R03]|nr:hypothetical protein [Trichodesmium sp. MAG_R03]